MSDSNDPHVKAVREMMARAKVAHDLARKNKRVDRTAARGHAHTAIKNMVRAAEYAKKHFTTSEQRSCVVGIESQFSPVLFRCMHAAFAKPLTKHLVGGATFEEATTEKDVILAKIGTCEQNIKKTQVEIVELGKKSKEKEAAIETAEKETERREAWLKNVKKRIIDVKDARVNLDNTHSDLDKQTVEVNKVYDPLTYVQRARTNIFAPYIAATWSDKAPTVEKLMKEANVDKNIFAEDWGEDYPAINKKLTNAYLKHKKTFQAICVLGSINVDIANVLQKIVEVKSWKTKIKDEILRHHDVLASCKWSQKDDFPKFEALKLDEVNKVVNEVRDKLSLITTTDNEKTLEAIEGDGNEVVEDLSQSIRIVVRVLNRDIVDYQMKKITESEVDYQSSLQIVTNNKNKETLRWLPDKGDVGQKGIQNKTEAKITYGGDVDHITKERGGERFYGPFYKVLGPKQAEGGIVNVTNEEFYKESLEAPLGKILKEGGKVLSGAYGYSGSGKTYGFFNSGEEDKGALYRFIDTLDKKHVASVKVRVRELYAKAPAPELETLGVNLEDLTLLHGKVIEYGPCPPNSTPPDCGTGTNKPAKCNTIPGCTYTGNGECLPCDYKNPNAWVELSTTSANPAANLPHEDFHKMPKQWWELYSNIARETAVSVSDLHVGQRVRTTTHGTDGFKVKDFTIRFGDEDKIFTAMAWDNTGVAGESTTTVYYDSTTGVGFTIHGVKTGLDDVKGPSENDKQKYKNVLDNGSFKWNDNDTINWSRQSACGDECSQKSLLQKLWAATVTEKRQTEFFPAQTIKVNDNEHYITFHLADSLNVLPLRTKREVAMDLDVEEKWHSVCGKEDLIADNDMLRTKIQSIYEQVNVIRLAKGRVAKTINNPESSRGHLAFSLRVKLGDGADAREATWTILDMAGSESATAMLRDLLGDDKIKLSTWNQQLITPQSFETMCDKMGVEGGVKGALGKIQTGMGDNANTANQSTLRTVLEQAFGINATNMEFLAWLRSKDQAVGSFNVAHGVMDKGLRKHALNVILKNSTTETTRGVVTNMTANVESNAESNADVRLKYVLDPDDIEDIKPVLKRMYTIKQKDSDEDAILTVVASDGRPYPFETKHVKSEKLDELKSYYRVELRFDEGMEPKGYEWEKRDNGSSRTDTTDSLRIGSRAYKEEKGDIDFHKGGYDDWAWQYYDECAKDNNQLEIVTAWILAEKNQGEGEKTGEEHLLRPQRDFYAWTGATTGDEPFPYAHTREEQDCRMIVYFQDSQFSSGWTFRLIGQAEKDREYKTFGGITTERLVGPMLTPSDLRDPISKVWKLEGSTWKENSDEGTKDNGEFLPANPLVIGPEIALLANKEGETCKTDACNYMRYDPTKSYSNPAAHLFWCQQDEKRKGTSEERKGTTRLEKMYKQFDGEWAFDSIQKTQKECIKRWNEWYNTREGPEPTSGYLGMVEFCEGATRTKDNEAPSKVIVCLTARTERMSGSAKRNSQARGVLATMQYANLLNPYSIESILQLKAGQATDNTSTTWDLCTKPFLDGMRQFTYVFRGGDVESFLSGPEMHWSDLRGGGSGDLEGDFLRLSDMVPSSDEEGESEVSVLMEFDLGSRRPAFW